MFSVTELFMNVIVPLRRAVVDCFPLDEQFRFLSGFCLATVRRASSVALHSKRPIHELIGARIGFTREAATSALLVKVLLTLTHHVQPAAYVAPEAAADAFLRRCAVRAPRHPTWCPWPGNASGSVAGPWRWWLWEDAAARPLCVECRDR
jgi:hypothetical protein